MENYIKCFKTGTKCLISMNFLLALVCGFTIIVYMARESHILSTFLLYYKSLFGVLALAFSILLIINSFLGLFSLVFKSSKLIRIYQFFGFFMSVLALNYSVLIFLQCTFYRSLYANRELCVIDKEFSNLARIYIKAGDLLCSQKCPCSLSHDKRYHLGYFIEEGAKSVMDCPNAINIFRNDEISLKALNNLENVYKCSGMCEKENIFMFSDINKGDPVSSCIYSIFKELFHFYIMIGSVLFVNSFILLLFSINSFFILHYSTEQGNYYQKLTP